MNSKLIISLISLIFLLPLSAGAVKKIEANPINVAVMLAQETDTSKMASTCYYYGYERQLTQDGYTVFTHPNGSRIRYTLPSDQKYPTIEVKSQATAKEKDQILKNLNFQKNGNTYECKSIGFITRCTNGPNGTVILTRNFKPQKE